LTRPKRGASIAFCSGLLLIIQSFLLSSCLELLLTRNCAVICAPQGAPVVLSFLPAAQCAPGRRTGYLSGFHRDFAQSYLHSLGGRGQPLIKTLEPPASIEGGKCYGLGPLYASLKVQPAYLHFSNGDPQISFLVPAAAVAIEEAQDVRFYKVKTWGLLWLFLSGRNKIN